MLSVRISSLVLMAPSGGDVYNVQANGGMAAGESEHIRESHKNTLKKQVGYPGGPTALYWGPVF